MAFSKFLDGMRGEMKELVSALKPYYKYVSVLGTDCSSSSYRVDRGTSSVSDSGGFEGECGFVVKVHDGRAFGEYALSSIAGDKKALAKKIVKGIALNEVDGAISCPVPADPVHKESFLRESDFDNYSDDEILKFCQDLKADILSRDDKILNAIIVIHPFVVNKLFISENRELDQHYGWINAYAIIVYRDEKIAQSVEDVYGNKMKEVFDKCYSCHAPLKLKISETVVCGYPEHEYIIKHEPSLACTKCTYSFQADHINTKRRMLLLTSLNLYR